MGRILIKGKKLSGQLGKTDSYTSFTSSSDEESATGGGADKGSSKKDPGKVSSDWLVMCFICVYYVVVVKSE